MNTTNSQVTTSIDDQIGIITINYPPVNALGVAVRQGLLDSIIELEGNTDCKIIMIQCTGKTFIAGADIREFGSTPLEPHLPDVVNRIARCSKPVVASMFGTVLGGGLEVALACHYRVALDSTKIGLPEVKLGLIPGAGGTQRLMRITGLEKAIEMITSGNHYPAKTLQDCALFDALFSTSTANNLTELKQLSLTFCRQLISDEIQSHESIDDLPVKGEDYNWDAGRSMVIKKARGIDAPVVAFDVIKDTWNKTVREGMAIERERFLYLKSSEQSAALRHVFSAEKKASKINTDAKPFDVSIVGVIGGGTMGVGIAICLLDAGYKVHLIEQSNEAATKAQSNIEKNYSSQQSKGRISEVKVKERLNQLAAGSDKSALAECQLVIEAVFEDIEVKKSLFTELDRICSDNTIFATNTSYLDINEIASASRIPERVIGMHFFSPAHIMKLLEVVQTDTSSDKVIATAMAVGKKLRKVAVLVKVCFGFAANRMYSRYGREIQQMLMEGAEIQQIDTAMKNYGMAMGPLAVQDLSGIDIGYKARKTRPFPPHDPGYFMAAATLVEAGHLGRKTSSGFYRYDESGKALPSDEAQELIKHKAQSLGFEPRQFTDEEIVHRALFAIISEALLLVKEGIVQRLSDIDIIWLYGYGFPRYRGGPLFQASQLGEEKVNSALKTLMEDFGNKIWPEVTYGQ